MRARRDLKAALADKWDSSREEQQRIAEILKRAAAEILRAVTAGAALPQMTLEQPIDPLVLIQPRVRVGEAVTIQRIR